MSSPVRLTLPALLTAAGAALAAWQMLPVLDLQPKAIILLIMIFLAVLMGSFFLLQKTLNKTSLSRRTISILAAVAIMGGFAIAFIFHLSFPQKELVLQTRTIQIRISDDTAGSGSRSLRFRSLNNRYRGIPFSDFTIAGDWQREGDDLVLDPVRGDESLTYNGKSGSKVALFFTPEATSAIVEIDWGDGRTETVQVSQLSQSQQSLMISHDYGPAAARLEKLNFLVNLYSIVVLLGSLIFFYLAWLVYLLKSRPRAFCWAFLLLSVATSVIRLVNVYHFPLGWDEGTYSRAAMQYGEKALSFQWAQIPEITYNHEHPALVKLTFAIPVILDARESFRQAGFSDWNNAELAKEDYTIFTGRLVSAVFSLLTVQVLTILINPIAGFFFMAHSLAEEFGAQARLEAMPMLFSFLSIWFFAKYLKIIRIVSKKKAAQTLILSAIFLGLTAASKLIYCVVAFAMAAVAISVWWKDRALWKRLLPAAMLFGVISLLTFFVFNPSMWVDPYNRIAMMFGFHENYQAQSSEIYPWWQPLVWVTRSVAHHPGIYQVKSPLGRAPELFFFSIDELIFILACIGFSSVWKRNKIYLFWFLFGLVFLFLWGTKWVQYACVLTVPLCIAAAYGAQNCMNFLQKKKSELRLD